MLEFKGQYTSCVVFNDEVEEEAIKQIYRFLSHPAFEGLKIRIMSDVHAGAGAVIGFTSTLGSKVIPNVIGVDIGCGMFSVCLGKKEIDLPALDKFIHENIPSGFSKRDTVANNKLMKMCNVTEYDLKSIEDAAVRTEQDVDNVMRSLGTLGGGNHFIELGVDELEHKWLTIHSGSRNFGLKIAKYHQAIAKTMNPNGDLSYLEGHEVTNAYFRDMEAAQEFAGYNRWLMAMAITWDHLKITPWSTESVECVHNYIDFDYGIVRKGAISAQPGERVIIPWNMRDGLIIGVGKGNEDWNCSAPHGAGRIMGRSAAKKSLQLEDFQESMKGIYSSCINAGTIDESPMAYKDAATIEGYLEPTVEITHRVKPIYNFKASEE
jgi:RNA-splicing ligase RtcB